MNFIIDCTHIEEWDGPIDEIARDATINLVLGIVDNIQLTNNFNNINLGLCLGYTVSFEFEDQEYDFVLEDLGNSTYRVADMENIPLFQAIKSMLQLKKELHYNDHQIIRKKI